MFRKRSFAVVSSLVVFIFAAAFPLSAQTMFGRISGTVVDPSGAAVSGAKVVVTNSDTQSSRTQATDEHGFFIADNLSIGPYVVAVEQAGFKRFQQANNFVAADARISS